MTPDHLTLAVRVAELEALVLALADRVAKQSELLTAAAGKSGRRCWKCGADPKDVPPTEAAE